MDHDISINLNDIIKLANGDPEVLRLIMHLEELMGASKPGNNMSVTGRKRVECTPEELQLKYDRLRESKRLYYHSKKLKNVYRPPSPPHVELRVVSLPPIC